MDNQLPIDEIAKLESRLGIKVTTQENLRELVARECWQSLLSTEEKRLQYRAKEKEIRGYTLDFGGAHSSYYIFNPEDEHNVFDIINSSACHFASKLRLSISYEANKSNGGELLLSRFDPAKWKGIPDEIAMEMLETIESKLNNATVAFAYFEHFSEASQLLRTFALSLLARPNIVVVLSSRYALSTLESDEINDYLDSGISVSGNYPITCNLLMPSQRCLNQFDANGV